MFKPTREKTLAVRMSVKEMEHLEHLKQFTGITISKLIRYLIQDGLKTFNLTDYYDYLHEQRVQDYSLKLKRKQNK